MPIGVPHKRVSSKTFVGSAAGAGDPARISYRTARPASLNADTAWRGTTTINPFPTIHFARTARTPPAAIGSSQVPPKAFDRVESMAPIASVRLHLFPAGIYLPRQFF